MEKEGRKSCVMSSRQKRQRPEEEEEAGRAQAAAGWVRERLAELERREGTVRPFEIRSPGDLARAREVKESATGAGWTLLAMRALGLLDTNQRAPGRCLGCYIPYFAVKRLMKGIAAGLPGNTRTAYLPDAVRVDLRAKSGRPADTVVVPGALDAVAGAFASKPALEFALCTVDIALPAGEGHEAMVRFTRRAAVSVEVSLLDVYNESDAALQAAMIDYLESRAPEPRSPVPYAAVPMKCKKFVLAMLGRYHQRSEAEREPAGYCQTWTTAALACSLAVDGADESEIAMDIMGECIEDGGAGLRGFARTVSACIIAENVRNRGESDGICGFECCEGVGCCDRPSTS